MPEARIQTAIDDSVNLAVGKNDFDDVVGIPIIPMMARMGEVMPQWWSFARDVYLRRFWKKGDHISTIMYTAQNILVNIPMYVSAKDPSITSHVEQAETLTKILMEVSEFGESFYTAKAKFVEDYLSQDNGAFMEVIGSGEPDGPIVGIPLSVRHLDSRYCWRTRSKDYPVVYHDPLDGGKAYKLHRTRVIYMSQMASPDAEMRGVGFCLHGDSSVRMADGSTKRIRDLVKSRSTEKVLSVDRNGKLCARSITNWYENDRSDRAMINIRGSKSKLIKGRQETNSWVTEDHPILTPSGWVEAGNLRTGDKIISSVPEPNKEQREFLIGTLLGDAHCQQGYDRARFSFGHSIKQEEWFDIKARILKNDFGFSKRYYDAKLNGKVFPQISAETRSNASLNLYRRAFYPDGVKTVPIDMVWDNATPLMFAAWYMDDGSMAQDEGKSPRAFLHMSSRSREDVHNLCWMMHDFGYECSPVSARGEDGKFDIALNVNGSKKFFSDIAPYIPGSMRYKIPDNLEEFDPQLWDLGKADVLVDTIEVSRRYNKNYSRPKKVYCIDVEDTHNFITANIVVHNCAVSRAIQSSQHLYDIYVHKQEKLGSRPVSKILVGSGFRGSHIMQAVKVANEAMNNMNLTRYSRVIGIGSDDVNASLDAIDLNDFDPFDEETSVTMAMYILSAAFGIPVQEVWPASASRSGRSGDIQESRQRGKLPAEFHDTLNLQLSQKYLPAHLEMRADWTDDYEDERRAVNRDIRARNRERDIGDGSITVRLAREQMVEDSEITRDQFRMMELGDGRLENGNEIGTLFYERADPYSSLLDLGVEQPTAIRLNDREEMLDACEQALASTLAELAGATSQRSRRKLTECQYALEWLKNKYETEAMVDDPLGFGDMMLQPGQNPRDALPNHEEKPSGVPESPGESGGSGEEQEDDSEGSSNTRTPDESREGTLTPPVKNA